MPDADDDVQLLHVNGETFDPDDLTYGEKRAVRNLIRTDLWDDAWGEFDWEEVGENEVLPATIAVFLARASGQTPRSHLDEALRLKPRDVYADDVPPTSSPDVSGPNETFAASGDPA